MKFKLMAGIVAAALCTSVLPSCSSSSEPYENVDLIPVKTSKKGKWSMMNAKGEIVYDSEFKYEPSMAINGVFVAEESNGYTVYTIDDKMPKEIEGLENLKSVGCFNEDVIPFVAKGCRIALADKKGNTKAVLEPYKDKEIVKCELAVSDGLLAIELEDGMGGYVNTSGEMVIEPEYNTVSNFSDGLAVVAKEASDSTGSSLVYQVIDKKGKVVFKLKEDQSPWVGSYRYGKLFASDGDNYFVYDKKGNAKKLPAKVSRVSDYNDKYIIFRTSDGEYGLMDYEGEVLIRAKYSGMNFAPGGNLFAKKDDDDDEILVLNTDGEEVKTLDYSGVAYFGKFGVLARDGKTFTLLDDKYESKSSEDFYELGLRSILSYRVESDYFNIEGAAKKVISMIDADGVGGVKFGTPASELIGEEASYRYTYRSNVDLHNLYEGFRYNIEAEGTFNAYMATSSYSGWTAHYSWNPDSKLSAVEMIVHTKCDAWGEEGYKALVATAKEKGFKLKKEGEYGYYDQGALLAKGNLYVVIYADKSSEQSRIYVWDNTLLPNLYGSILSTFKNLSPDEATVAEEAAVEEVDYE